MESKLLEQLFKLKYAYNPSTKKFDVASATNNICDQAKRSYMRGYTKEEIEDAFMDAVMYVYERALKDEAYAAKISISSVTYKMRDLARRAKFKANGYTQRGTVPISGMRPHIRNVYDENGNNIIESIGVDENGNYIATNGWSQK